MDYFKSLLNPYNVTMSSANIEQKVDKIIKKEESSPDVQLLMYRDPSGGKHHTQFRRLTEYLRLYKQRLYVVPKHQLTDANEDAKGMDFESFKNLRQRNDLNILDVVKEHQIESEMLYSQQIDPKLSRNRYDQAYKSVENVRQFQVNKTTQKHKDELAQKTADYSALLQ